MVIRAETGYYMPLVFNNFSNVVNSCLVCFSNYLLPYEIDLFTS